MATYKRCRLCSDIQRFDETEYTCFPCALGAYLRALSFGRRLRLALRIVVKGGDAVK